MGFLNGEIIDQADLLGAFTAGENISANDAVALDLSDGKIYKASASVWSYKINFIGFSRQTKLTNQTVLVNTSSLPTGLSVTLGSMYYLSDTAGAISTTPGTISRQIGIAVSASSIYRPKNRVPVSPFIGRGFSAESAFTHLDVIMASQGGTGRLATVNGSTLVSNSASQHMYITVPVVPNDVMTMVPVALGGGIGVAVRIVDV